MTERRLWSDLVGPAGFHHVARIQVLPDRASRLHTHDFPEIFWIESGAAAHTINGRVEMLESGDVVAVRPSDRHVLRAADSSGFALINVAYHPELRRSLLQRYPLEFAPVLAPKTPTPYRASVSKAQLADLRVELSWLIGRQTRLATEHFLLSVRREIQPLAPQTHPPIPDWLENACREIEKAEYFTEGAMGLVRAARRSPEHVARTVRSVFGVTPSDYVNRVRMNFAACELRMSPRPIIDVALACGISNMSHFYCLFRAAHGLTPRAYRLRHFRSFD